MSECGAEGKPFQLAFKAKAGKRGFQPQSKPPVHTGGFDLCFRSVRYRQTGYSGDVESVRFSTYPLR